MKKFIFIMLLFSISLLFAQQVTIKLKNGKTIVDDITKIEASNYDGTFKMETSYMTLASGTSELRTQIKDIKSIKFVKSGDVSCFEDSRFAPIRKYCTIKSQYIVTLRKKKKKKKIEVIDNRKFFITLKKSKKTLSFFLHKIKVSNEKQPKKTYNDLTQQVLNFSKDGIDEILFK
jgi:hypothetical protein